MLKPCRPCPSAGKPLRTHALAAEQKAAKRRAGMASQGAMGLPRREDRGRGETMVLGLTGSIGMGKSTVSAMFRELGVAVNDADAVVHELYAKGGAAVEPVRRLFGDEVIGEDGGISRPALSKFVVGEANAENLKKVEEVVFPLVDHRRYSKL